jgi:ubiquinone/menaquinone biosynthesis C-methylase UbiE
VSELQPHLALFAEPMRVRLLSLLADEELGVGELTRIAQVPQSTVSRHLKDLRVAGWIRRRSEGTAGLFRMDATELPEAARELWAVIRDDHRTSPQAEEDRVRLKGVLEARIADGRTFFGRVSREWDQVRRDLFGDAFRVATLVSLLPHDRVVADLGCGTGETLAELAPVVRKVIGVDREQAMLDVATERVGDLPNVELHRGGLEDLPIADAACDAVLCMLVLHHVVELEQAFAEMRRIVRAPGRVVILDMIAHDRQEYRHTMGHVHLGFSEARIRELARGAKFAKVHWRAIAPSVEAQGPPLFVAALDV